MHYPTIHRKQEQDIPPTVKEDTKRKTQSKAPVQDEKYKARASIPPSVTKPLPTRMPSTRIQEPKRTPSQTTSKPHTNGNQSEKPQRPALQRSRTTARTRYIDMLLGLDHVSPLHNILASLSVWILLAGYIVFPATFNKLKNDDLDNKANTSIEKHALNTVRNVPLLYVAAFACGLGIMGSLWLWWQHRKNYVWVINRIFMPALLNSLAGLVSTLVNVYSAQDGQFSVTAKVTVVVTAACSVVAAGLFLLYNTVMLKLVKRRHEREVRDVERWDNEDGDSAGRKPGGGDV